MPDLGILNLSSLTLSRRANLKPVSSDQCDSGGSLYSVPVKTLVLDQDLCCNWDQSLELPIEHEGLICNGNEIRVFRRPRGSAERSKKSSGTKSLDAYVKSWAARKIASGVPERKCFLPFLVGVPRLACFICKQKPYWRCVHCTLASHDKCAAFPEGVIHLNDLPGRAVCWRHPTDWQMEKKD